MDQDLKREGVFRQIISFPDLCFGEAMTGSLEAAMGFVAKSVFWLGLVYSAMPFDCKRYEKTTAPGGEA